jgi:hypothetical protein
MGTCNHLVAKVGEGKGGQIGQNEEKPLMGTGTDSDKVGFVSVLPRGDSAIGVSVSDCEEKGCSEAVILRIQE